MTNLLALHGLGLRQSTQWFYLRSTPSMESLVEFWRQCFSLSDAQPRGQKNAASTRLPLPLRYTRMSMLTLPCRLIRKQCAGGSRSTGFYLPCLTASAPSQLQEVSSFLRCSCLKWTHPAARRRALLRPHSRPCLRDGDEAMERAVMRAEEIQRLLG